MLSTLRKKHGGGGGGGDGQLQSMLQTQAQKRPMRKEGVAKGRPEVSIVRVGGADASSVDSEAETGELLPGSGGLVPVSEPSLPSLVASIFVFLLFT